MVYIFFFLFFFNFISFHLSFNVPGWLVHVCCACHTQFDGTVLHCLRPFQHYDESVVDLSPQSLYLCGHDESTRTRGVLDVDRQ